MILTPRTEFHAEFASCCHGGGVAKPLLWGLSTPLGVWGFPFWVLSYVHVALFKGLRPFCVERTQMEGERSITAEECTIRPLNSSGQIFCPQCRWREESQGMGMLLLLCFRWREVCDQLRSSFDSMGCAALWCWIPHSSSAACVYSELVGEHGALNRLCANEYKP